MIYVLRTSDQDLSAMYQFLSVADMADKEDIAPKLGLHFSYSRCGISDAEEIGTAT
jgi:hypothetical protein